jgi:tRNA-dihydrouridine synthase B
MLVSGHRKSLALVETNTMDRPLSVQIFSGVADDLVRAAKWLEDHDYEGVDINMGCPMAKVNSSGGGARLMCQTDAARTMAARVVDSVSIPVTVKMRLGWDEENITAPELARAFEEVGVAAITVHGRTRAQGFRGSVNRAAIRATVRATDRIPVIANGDVVTPFDALAMMEETGCAAVAIGRGAMMDPWIFERIRRIQQDPTADFCPTAEQQIEFLIDLFRLMEQQHGDYACILFRKFAAWCGQRLGIPEDLEDRLRRLTSAAEFNGIVQQIRQRHGDRKSQVPTALVKVPNGPVALW